MVAVRRLRDGTLEYQYLHGAFDVRCVIWGSSLADVARKLDRQTRCGLHVRADSLFARQRHRRYMLTEKGRAALREES